MHHSPAGGAYSAHPDPMAAFSGAYTSKGEEENAGEGKGMEGKGKEGRGGEKWAENGKGW